VRINGEIWTTADAGQGMSMKLAKENGFEPYQCAAYIDRHFIASTGMLTGEISKPKTRPARRIPGWLSIDRYFKASRGCRLPGW
jgi:hypothetical protein